MEFAMGVTINKDILMGKWKQLKGQVRQQWGKLTDDQVERVGGRYEELVGMIQERYGYTRDQAQQQVDDFLKRFEKSDTKERPRAV
jgi:uncharacterized protein YjbJ (UPF0337 family)